MSSATHIRRATPDDAPALATIYAHYVRSTLVTFELDPPDAAELVSRMAQSIAWLVCETAQDAQVVGYAYARPYKAERPAYDVTVEISVYVRHDGGWMRRGVGRALVNALLAAVRDIQRDNAQRYHQVLAIQAKPASHDEEAEGHASGGFYRALGFVRAGTLRRVGYKLGMRADVELWQKDIEG